MPMKGEGIRTEPETSKPAPFSTVGTISAFGLKRNELFDDACSRADSVAADICFGNELAGSALGGSAIGRLRAVGVKGCIISGNGLRLRWRGGCSP